jgi:uncharacterized protein YqgV (UPF0045/DUF77 family)
VSVVSLVVEFTIEPFVEGDPGPHVRSAVEAAEAAGVTVDFGPFGTTVSGEDDAVLDAVDRVLRVATASGATRVSLQVVREGS